MEVTRRDFIKVSGVFLCGLFATQGEATNLSCPSCKALNLFPNKCLNCGKGLIEGIGCNNCVKKYNCLQIPFPNHKYLIETDKPLLTTEAIKF
ncbi:MAG: hypothetical protein HY752_01780 [Nitrospirae bacterium]|nr:hypothetical protein [Nitrospirota bacterium]